MGAELNQKLFSAADNLRSKMDASEYKNYLLGLIFYKYLSDKLLEKVVELAGESLDEFSNADKQTVLYRQLLEDEGTKSDLIETLVHTLGYDIAADHLFNVFIFLILECLFYIFCYNSCIYIIIYIRYTFFYKFFSIF